MEGMTSAGGASRGATLAALRRCCLKSINATCGRGTAGAVREARNALQHAGHDAAAALQMALAMAAVGDRIADVLAAGGRW